MIPEQINIHLFWRIKIAIASKPCGFLSLNGFVKEGSLGNSSMGLKRTLMIVELKKN